MTSYTIGQIAKQAGITVETIRYYEKNALIPAPTRSKSGYRLYTVEAIKRLHFIKSAKQVGFTLREIADLLNVRQTPTASSKQIKQLAADKIEQINEKIKDLTLMRNALQALESECDGKSDLGDCPILSALDSVDH